VTTISHKKEEPFSNRKLAC